MAGAEHFIFERYHMKKSHGFKSGNKVSMNENLPLCSKHKIYMPTNQGPIVTVNWFYFFPPLPEYCSNLKRHKNIDNDTPFMHQSTFINKITKYHAN
jgi:hypothetical protein